jgi:hypothetical protein
MVAFLYILTTCAAAMTLGTLPLYLSRMSQ